VKLIDIESFMCRRLCLQRFIGREATLAALCVTSYSVSAGDRIRDWLRQLVTCLNQWDSEYSGQRREKTTSFILWTCWWSYQCCYCHTTHGYSISQLNHTINILCLKTENKFPIIIFLTLLFSGNLICYWYHRRK